MMIFFYKKIIETSEKLLYTIVLLQNCSKIRNVTIVLLIQLRSILKINRLIVFNKYIIIMFIYSSIL